MGIWSFAVGLSGDEMTPTENPRVMVQNTQGSRQHKAEVGCDSGEVGDNH